MGLFPYIHKKIAKIYYSHLHFFVFCLRRFFYILWRGGQRNKDAAIFLLPHAGLGDMLALSGMVRQLAKKNKIILVIMWRTRHEARFLFRDERNIGFYPIYSDRDIAPVKNGVPQPYNTWKINMLAKLGLKFQTMGVYLPQPSISDDASEEKKGRVHDILYDDMNIPLASRHHYFSLQRDKNREEEFYRRVVGYLKTDNYVVVHDDPGRGFMIDEKKIPEIKNGKTKIFYIGKGRGPIKAQTIFDTISVLERAKAFHGFDSSFMWLVELLGLPTPSYLHGVTKGKHTRPHKRNQSMARSFKKKWILVK